MPGLLERYKGGEHEQVWSELLALGPAVREEPLYAEALAVAQETMWRAKRNVEILIDHLTSIRYRFGEYPDGSRVPYYEGPLVRPSGETLKQISKLEARVGPVPLAIRVWWETVGWVDLIGRHPDWPANADPLVVDPPEAALASLGDWEIPDEEGTKSGATFVPLAPDDFHKDNISGGDPYGILLPNAAIDAKFENEWHETSFVNYLRICFRWGGFPGLERANSRFKWLPKLTADLLPL